MANRPGRLRLILCGICFKAECPLSRWVEEDGDVSDMLDIMREEYFERMHNEIDKMLASKLTVEEKRERIVEAIKQAEEETGEKVEIDNLEELLGQSVKLESESVQTEKGSFIDDILSKYGEHIEKPTDDKQKQN